MSMSVDPSIFYNPDADASKVMFSARVLRNLSIRRDQDFDNKGILSKLASTLVLEVALPIAMAFMVIESLLYLIGEAILFVPNKCNCIDDKNSIYTSVNGGFKLGIKSMLHAIQLALSNLIVCRPLVETNTA